MEDGEKCANFKESKGVLMDNDLELFKQWMQTDHMQRAFEEWKGIMLNRDWAITSIHEAVKAMMDEVPENGKRSRPLE